MIEPRDELDELVSDIVNELDYDLYKELYLNNEDDDFPIEHYKIRAAIVQFLLDNLTKGLIDDKFSGIV